MIIASWIYGYVHDWLRNRMEQHTLDHEAYGRYEQLPQTLGQGGESLDAERFWEPSAELNAVMALSRAGADRLEQSPATGLRAGDRGAELERIELSQEMHVERSLDEPQERGIGDGDPIELVRWEPDDEELEL
jgi:hypothetical protein